MSLVRILRGDQRAEERSGQLPSNFNDWLRLRLGGASATLEGSESISEALGHPVVYRSVSKIAGIVAQMPWDAFRGGRELPRPNLLQSPSRGVLRPSSWKRAAATSMLLRGGAYGLVGTDTAGMRIDLIFPDRVTWTVRDGWMLDHEPVEEFPAGPLWQVPYATLPGSPKGLNPLAFARRTTFAGLAAAEFGSNFFRDGAHPSAIARTATDPGPDGARALKEAFNAAVSGTNRELLVVPQSIEWDQIQVSPEDSQFIELMQFTGGMIAGFFGLQPEHVGLPADGGGMTYSNRENRQQDLLQDAVMPVILPIEEAMSELLPRGQDVKFNPAGILRADLKARYESYKIASEINQTAGDGGEPFLSIEEMRELENR